MASTLLPTNSTLAGSSVSGSAGLEPQDFDARDRALDAEHVALYLVLAFFSVLGVIGNAIAFYIFFLRRNSGTSVIFILALAGTDFITCLVTVPYTIVFEAMQYRLYYDGLCKMYMFFITSTIPYSSFIMAGIAFDRYFCICHPFLQVLNVQRARLVVLCLALPAFTFGIITGMSYGMFMEVHYVIANGSYFLGTNLSTELAEHPDSFTNIIYLTDLQYMEGGHLVETPHTFGNDSTVHWLPTYRIIVHNTECVMNNFYFTEDFQTWFRHVYTSCYVLCFVTVVSLYILIYKFIFTHRAMKAKRRRKNYYTSVANTEPSMPHHNPTVEAETAMTELNGNESVLTKTTNINANNATTKNTTTASTTTTTTTSFTDTTVSNNTNTTEVTATTGTTTPATTTTTTTTTTTSSVTNADKSKVGTKNTNGTANVENAVREVSRLPKRRGSTTRDRNLYANIKTAMMLFVVTLVFIVAFAPAWLMAHQLAPMQLNVFYMYFVYNVANPFIYAFMNQTFREDLKKLLKRS